MSRFDADHPVRTIKLNCEVSLSNRRIVVLSLNFMAVFALTSCYSSKSSPPSKESQSSSASHQRKLAPDFTLQDANGQSVSLSEYRGKVVLLNFWATWCGPCELEIPWFENFEQEYKSKGFEVIGVSMDEDGWKVVKPFIAQHKVNYRVLLGNDSVSQLYGGVESLPTTFLIDRDGKFAFSPHIGLAERNQYLNEIQTLLGIKQTAAARRVLSPVPALFVPGPAK
jgi:cytochrome c biogenesis protein CcmG/thiol:disulfide interchange protein DsbE